MWNALYGILLERRALLRFFAKLTGAVGVGRRRRKRLPTFKGGGLRPGVDLSDSAGLLDLMDGNIYEAASTRTERDD
jgi:hypothetical protein